MSETWQVIEGDCLEVMRGMDEASVDAICTDPPYGLEFMGKEWDRLWHSDGTRTRTTGRQSTNPLEGKPRYGTDSRKMQAWHETWAREALRVLKPGGYLLAAGGTRTFHRLVCALEDAGFEIRDTIMHIYGSGFPKSKNVGNGWGSALKPAQEPWTLARKPLAESSIARQVLSTGTGALNVDGCRVGASGGGWNGLGDTHNEEQWRLNSPDGIQRGGGRFPANLLLSHSAECVRVGERRVKGSNAPGPADGVNPQASYGGNGWKQRPDQQYYADPDGTETVEAYECAPDCPVRLLDEQSGQSKSTDRSKYAGNQYAEGEVFTLPQGRFPANLLLSHSTECRATGEARKVKSGKAHRTNGVAMGYHGSEPAKLEDLTYADPDGTEQVEAYECAPDCPVRLLDEQSGTVKSGGPRNGQNGGKPSNGTPFSEGWNVGKTHGDQGGASRFFQRFEASPAEPGFIYVAKASRRERNAGLEGMPEKPSKSTGWSGDSMPERKDTRPGRTNQTRPEPVASNNHPTVKPIALMRYLCRLITPPGGTVLDPFCGSGSTGCAAVQEGFNFVGIEKEAEYAEIARRRIAYWSQPEEVKAKGKTRSEVFAAEQEAKRAELLAAGEPEMEWDDANQSWEPAKLDTLF